jgi:hypothetical protein
MVKVFVSHSSVHDPYSEHVRVDVCARLAKKNYEVLVDDALQGGDEWRSMLYHWLADCQGAVLLLNHAALASNWVRREVNLLLWRRALGSAVHVIPALLGDVYANDVKNAGFSELEPLQFARIRTGTTTEQDAETLAEQIVNQFPELAEPTVSDPMRDWIDRITFRLGKVEWKEKLVDAARALHVHGKDLAQVLLPEGPRFLAHQLLGRELDRPIDEVGKRTYKAVVAVVDYMGWESQAGLIEEVIPTWVDADGARQLLTATDQPDHAVILLNARHQDTGVDYILRATCRARDGYRYEVVGTEVGEDVVGELGIHFEKAVAELLCVEPPWTLADLNEEAELRDGTCFLVLKPPEHTRLDLVADAVRTLQDRFPWLVVMVLIGEAPPDDVARIAWTPGNVLVLDPPLLGNEERLARRVVSKLRNLYALQGGRVA